MIEPHDHLNQILGAMEPAAPRGVTWSLSPNLPTDSVPRAAPHPSRAGVADPMRLFPVLSTSHSYEQKTEGTYHRARWPSRRCQPSPCARGPVLGVVSPAQQLAVISEGARPMRATPPLALPDQTASALCKVPSC